MKTTLSAITVSILMAGSAHAACNPNPTPSGGDTLTINAQDCHLKIENPEVLPVTPGTEIVIRDPNSNEIGSDGGALINGVNSALGDNADAIQINADKNDEQDDAIEANAEDIAALTEEMYEGLAMSSALHIPHVEKSFAGSLTGGFHNDKSAIGLGAAAKINETFQFGGSVSFGTDSGDVAGKAALTGQW